MRGDRYTSGCRAMPGNLVSGGMLFSSYRPKKTGVKPDPVTRIESVVSLEVFTTKSLFIGQRGTLSVCGRTVSEIPRVTDELSTCPGGTSENSSALQRRVGNRVKGVSPGGATEPHVPHLHFWSFSLCVLHQRPPGPDPRNKTARPMGVLGWNCA